MAKEGIQKILRLLTHFKVMLGIIKHSEKGEKKTESAQTAEQ